VSTVFERYHWSALALAGMVLVVAGNLLVLRRKEIAAAPTPAPFSSSKHPSRPPRG